MNDNAGSTLSPDEVMQVPSSRTMSMDGHLLELEEKYCPPRGSNSVILYTTSLRGIRKTFDDCQTIKFLLNSFQITYYERDVSMDLGFKEELWRLLGGHKVIPPRLFIRGRYIGGADEVVDLHEQGELKSLLQDIPLAVSNQLYCKVCDGIRFTLCCACDGSRKMATGDGRDPVFDRCRHCNENGLVKCSFCCY
ncbi:hypothetical protein Dimus_007435 [Dionaea muscipula]